MSIRQVLASFSFGDALKVGALLIGLGVLWGQTSTTIAALEVRHQSQEHALVKLTETLDMLRMEVVSLKTEMKIMNEARRSR